MITAKTRSLITISIAAIFVLVFGTTTVFSLNNARLRTRSDNNIYGAFSSIETTNANLNGVPNGLSYHRIMVYDESPKVSANTVCSSNTTTPRFVEYGWVKRPSGYNTALAYGVVSDLLCTVNLFFPQANLTNGSYHNYQVQYDNCVAQNPDGSCAAGHIISYDGTVVARVRRGKSGVNVADRAEGGGEVSSTESMGKTELFALFRYVKNPSGSGRIWESWPDIEISLWNHPYYNNVWYVSPSDPRPASFDSDENF